MAQGTHTLLTDIIDIDTVNLQREGDEKAAVIDRDFGIDHAKLSDIKLLRLYLDEFGTEAKPTNGQHFQNRSTLIGIVILLLGLLSGYFSSVGLLQYDGSEPVNVLRFIAVLFFIQGFSLLTFIVAIIGLKSEGMAWIINTFSISNWVSRIGVGKSDWLTRIPMVVWQSIILTKSQIFITFFFIGALVGLLYQATISDIAFGWSTTLEFTNDAFFRFCQSLSKPWRDLVPGATVDASLVDATRYFRLHGQDIVTDAGTFGKWWRFLAMTVLVWGISLRLITWLLSYIIERRILKSTLIESAAGNACLTRMRNPVVSTRSDGEEAEFVKPPIDDSIVKTQLPSNVDCVVFSGSFEAKNVILERLGLVGKPWVEIGAHQSIDEDREAISKIAKKGNDIVMVVKAWEPPIMDTIDNIESILALSPKLSLTVCPLASDFTIDSIEDYHIDAWQQALSRFPTQQVSMVAHD